MFYFKAEANEKVGGGHLHRCLSLAHELKKQGCNSEFIVSESTIEAKKKIISEGFIFHEITPQKSLLAESYVEFCPENSLIIFDTDKPEYHSGTLITKLKQAKRYTANFTVTDKHPVTTDLLINPNIISETHSYRTAPHTKKLLGPKYMIFNDRIRRTHITVKQKNPTGNLLVFFGNADPDALSLKFIDALPKTDHRFQSISLLIGSLNANSEQVDRQIKRTNPYKIRILKNIKDMPALYAQTDLALVSAGMTMWEAALWEIPLMVISSGEREKAYTDYLNSKNFIRKIGESDKITPEQMANEINRQFTDKLLFRSKRRAFADLADVNGIQNLVAEFINLNQQQP